MSTFVCLQMFLMPTFMLHGHLGVIAGSIYDEGIKKGGFWGGAFYGQIA
jgi:hypothetical protein